MPMRSLLLALALLRPRARRRRRGRARTVPRGWLGVIADGPLTGPDAGRSTASGTAWPPPAPRACGPRSTGARPSPTPRLRRRCRPARRPRSATRAASRWTSRATTPSWPAPPARRLGVLPIVHRDARLGGREPAGRRLHRRAAPRRLRRVPRRARAPLRPRRLFWAEHPELPRCPIRDWQVWNEPNLTRYWSRQPFARVLRAAAARRRPGAARPPTRGARTVLAGLPNESFDGAARDLPRRRRAALRRGALHPYTGKPRNVVKLVELARAEIRRARDGALPVWVTELSWPAALGKTQNIAGFETTDRGQAARLRSGPRAPRAPRAGGCGSSASTGTRGSRTRRARTRSTTPACAAWQAAGGQRAGARAVPRGRAAARRAARRSAATRRAVAERPRRSPRAARAHVKPAARARPAARSAARARRVAQQPEQRLAQRLGLGRGEPRGAARGLRQRGRAGGDDRASRTPSPRARAGRSPRRRDGSTNGLGAGVEAGQERVVDVAERAAGRRGPPRRRTAGGAPPATTSSIPSRASARAAGPERAEVLARGVGGDAEHVRALEAERGARRRGVRRRGEALVRRRPGPPRSRSGATPSSSTISPRENSDTVTTCSARRASAGSRRACQAA